MLHNYETIIVCTMQPAKEKNRNLSIICVESLKSSGNI